MPETHSIPALACAPPGRRRTHTAAALAAMCVLGMLVAGPASALAASQPDHGSPAATAADAHAPAEGAHGEAAHGESLVSFLSRIANFLILAGGLYYLLRSPVGKYLAARGQQIRSDLEQAAATRAQATSRLADIDRRLKALPAEVEALTTRGREEIAAEQVRMKQTAEAERRRLVELARREIDRQLHIAQRELTEHAADLAVAAARGRLSREVTAEDQMRLVDRYVAQVGSRHE